MGLDTPDRSGAMVIHEHNFNHFCQEVVLVWDRHALTPFFAPVAQRRSDLPPHV